MSEDTKSNMKNSSSRKRNVLVKPAVTFESLPAEIRQQILFEATEIEDFDQKLEGFGLYGDASRPITGQRLRTFGALLSASKAFHPDLLFAAKKHRTKLSDQIAQLPDPGRVDNGRKNLYCGLNKVQWKYVRILKWYMRAERKMAKTVKQLQFEVTGEEIEEIPKPKYRCGYSTWRILTYYLR